MNHFLANAAQLALAAYGALVKGETRLQQGALLRAEFTDRQAQDFAQTNPTVVAQFDRKGRLHDGLGYGMRKTGARPQVLGVAAQTLQTG